MRPSVLCKWAALMLILVTTSLVTGCGSQETTPSISETEPPAQTQTGKPEESTPEKSEARAELQQEQPEAKAKEQEKERAEETQAYPAPSPEQVELAKKIIRQQSCGGCHTIQAQGLHYSGQVGPDLSREGERGRTPEWLRRQLTQPTAIPNTEVVEGYEGKQVIMHTRHLSDRELEALVAFLLGLRGQPSAPGEPEPAPDRAELAKQVFQRMSCGSCHTLQAAGLSYAGRIGPDLTHEGRRVRSDEWLRRQLVDPTSIPDSEVVKGYQGTQIMHPSYGRLLTERELEAIIAFLQGLQ